MQVSWRPKMCSVHLLYVISIFIIFFKGWILTSRSHLGMAAVDWGPACDVYVFMGSWTSMQPPIRIRRSCLMRLLSSPDCCRHVLCWIDIARELQRPASYFVSEVANTKGGQAFIKCNQRRNLRVYAYLQRFFLKNVIYILICKSIYICVDSLLSDYLIFQEKLETWNIN